MQVSTTISPKKSTRSVLPFSTAKGAKAHGESVAMTACSGATYFGSENHEVVSAVNAPGLGSVAEALEDLAENGALVRYIVCVGQALKPLASTKAISPPGRAGVARPTSLGKSKNTRVL